MHSSRVIPPEAVRATRLDSQNDLKILVNSPLDAQISNIVGDYVVFNDGDLSVFQLQLYAIVDDLRVDMPNLE